MAAPRSKTRIRPVIRVFISSTFSDMKHERNALQQHVFPALERLCLENGFYFQAIDLRWGVSTEASLDHRTMSICLGELRRAQDLSPRPNFLVLLGNRYGWRPLPEQISADEFRKLENAAEQLSAKADNSPLAVLRRWYLQDTNADPSVHLLQSRWHRRSDGKDFTNDAAWETVQSVLWQVINHAMHLDRFRRRFDVSAVAGNLPPPIIRFHASATEQEIWYGALAVADAREHVLAFRREIENIDEFLADSQIKSFVDVDPSGRIDAELKQEQKRLADALCGRLDAANVFGPRAARLIRRVDGRNASTIDVTTDHLPQLCKDLERRLRDIVQRQFEEYWQNAPPVSARRKQRELQIEQEEHNRFGRERGRNDLFVGRTAELKTIVDYVRNASRYPLLVHGTSGCGKTALLARAAQELAGDFKPIVRYIGITRRTTDVRSLLTSLCEELPAASERELPIEPDAVALAFRERLSLASVEHPIVVFLDALDQLSDADEGRALGWIPFEPLPPHVKMIVSCLSDRPDDDPAGRPFEEFKRQQLPAENVVCLDALSEDEALQFVFERWLPHAGRKLAPHQYASIARRLASPACRQPIYLKLLCEQAQHWHSYEEASELGEGLPVLLDQFVSRLSRKENHGPLLVSRVLGYLAASRHGLAENEILEILFADPDYRLALEEFGARTGQDMPADANRIPFATWSRLRFDLAPYLADRADRDATVLAFYHRQVGEWVSKDRTTIFADSWRPHERLVRYFRRKGDPQEDASWRGGNARALEELPYHLAKAGDISAWQQTMCDPQFFGAACTAGLVFELLRDTDAGLGQWPSSGVRAMRQAVASSLRTIVWHPAFALSAICNRLFGYEAEDDALRVGLARARARLDASGPWFEAAWPFRAAEGIVFGHPSTRDGPAGGDLPYFFKAFVAARDAIVAANSRGNMEVRDVRRGALMTARKLPTTGLTALAIEPVGLRAAWIEGTGEVRAEGAQGAFPGRAGEEILAFPAADSVIAVRHDGALVSWNPQTGKGDTLIAELPFPLIALRATPDGCRLVLVAGERPESQFIGLLSRADRAWHVERLAWKGRPATDACLQPDSANVLLAGVDRVLTILDATSGAVLKQTAYEQRSDVQLRGRIAACAFGGREDDWAVAAATEKGQVFRWRWQSDRVEPYDDYKGLQEGYSSILLEFAAGGDQVFFAMADRGAFLTRRGAPLEARHHTTAVTGCAVTASGKLASISREERVLRWWEFDGPRPLQTFAIDAPAAIAAAGDEDTVFVATLGGCLHRCTIEREPGLNDIICPTERPLVGVISDDAVTAIVAASEGTIFRVHFADDPRPDPLYSHVSDLRQRTLLRCGQAHVNYIAIRQTIVRDQDMVISLGTGVDQETEIHRSAYRSTVAASQSGTLLATADVSLTVWRLDERRLSEAFKIESESRVAAMQFICDDAFLIVARESDGWLELRRCVPGLPLVDILELPAEPTCLCARDDRIAIGLRSGALLCIRLHHGALA